MKGKRVIILAALHVKMVELQSNNMSIEKTRLLSRDLVYWINMNANMPNKVNSCNMLQIPTDTAK